MIGEEANKCCFKRYVIIEWSILHGVNKYGFEASEIWLDPSCLLEVNYQRGGGGMNKLRVVPPMDNIGWVGDI